jgi:hypothetical protein
MPGPLSCEFQGYHFSPEAPLTSIVLSPVFCLLLNKVQFVRDSTQLSISTLSLSRATLCEILAVRVLREWLEYKSGIHPESELEPESGFGYEFGLRSTLVSSRSGS